MLALTMLSALPGCASAASYGDMADDPSGVAGTICDHTARVEGGIVIAETSTGTYDSTDSYAALFLMTLDGYARRYGDYDFLRARASGIRLVISAMLSTMKGGYTYACPEVEEYYLMDNCEVYAGLRCAVHLCDQVLGDRGLSAQLTRHVLFYEAHFAEDWRQGDHYMDALSAEDFSWDTFYQCAASQAFPVLFGLIAPDSAEAETLYRRFCQAFAWEELAHMTSGQTEYYWGHLVLWGALMGDAARVDAYLAQYASAVGTTRPYPLVGADAALILTACDLLAGNGATLFSEGP